MSSPPPPNVPTAVGAPATPPSVPSELGPVRCIYVEPHLKLFQESETYANLVKMVERITEALTMFPTADADPNPIVERTVTVLKTLQKSVEDFPVTSRPVRFGSPQFREWHTHLSDNISTYLSHITSNAPLTSPPSSELPSSHLELRSHLLISFGHPTRLDYGTGHELSFLIFLILVLPPLSPPTTTTSHPP